jgi:Leucine-rich repeat (LRR) protein
MLGREHYTQQKMPNVTFDNIRIIYTENKKSEQSARRKDKKISDLPAGSVTLSFGSLNLRERKMTSLEGLEILPELKTLYIQDNLLKDLRYLNQPNLESLHAERNNILDFGGCQRQPKLRSVHLEGNGVENSDLFTLMCCLSLNPELLRVNGQIITKSERELISMLDRPALLVAMQQVLAWS